MSRPAVRRWTTAALYVLGLAGATATAYVLGGALAAGVAAWVLALALGGIKPLALILWYGLAKMPPTDWFRDDDG